MIKFFRNIRRSLVQTNGGKYLLYAIGEVFLVVIGILIALQINNWNEDRIRKIKEIELLKAFHLELKTHNNRIDEMVAFSAEVLKAAEILYAALDKRKPYEKNMDSLFYQTTNFNFGDQFSSATLDNLKSVGVDIISNQKLRNEIILVYSKFSYIREAQDIYVDMITDAGKGLLSTRFDELWKGDFTNYLPAGVMHPLNYNLLLDDQEYKYFLKSIPNYLGWFVFKPCAYTKTAIEDVILLIEEELVVL